MTATSTLRGPEAHTTSSSISAKAARSAARRCRSSDLVRFGGFLQQSGYRSGQLLGQSLEYGRVV